MATQVRIPTTGNAGEDAVVVEWNASVGDPVVAGQTLLVIETAKSTVDVESPASGVLLQRYAEAGDEIAEFAVAGLIGDSATLAAAPELGPVIQPAAEAAAGPPTMGDEEAAEPSAGSPDRIAEVASAASFTRGSTAATTSGVATTDDKITADDKTTAATATDRPRRLSVSPRARRMAAERHIALDELRGTGPFGRIVGADVLAHDTASEPAASQPLARSAAAAASAPAPSPRPMAPLSEPDPEATVPVPSDSAGSSSGTTDPLRPVHRVPVRGARRVTAQRMHESLSSTAQVTLTRYADVDNLLQWLGRLRSAALGQDGPRIGVNEAVLYATARTVVRHPQANSWFSWEGIDQFDRVALGFAVETDDALLVPVIRDADTLSIGQLARATRRAIAVARAGRLTAEEMAGATFTVSNLGSAGVHWFTPVLNPPQSCILGVGAIHRSHPEATSSLPLSLTFDHRALDGAAAARLLADLAAAIATIDVLNAL